MFDLTKHRKLCSRTWPNDRVTRSTETSRSQSIAQYDIVTENHLIFINLMHSTLFPSSLAHHWHSQTISHPQCAVCVWEHNLLCCQRKFNKQFCLQNHFPLLRIAILLRWCCKNQFKVSHWFSHQIDQLIHIQNWWWWCATVDVYIYLPIRFKIAMSYYFSHYLYFAKWIRSWTKEIGNMEAIKLC